MVVCGEGGQILYMINRRKFWGGTLQIKGLICSRKTILWQNNRLTLKSKLDGRQKSCWNSKNRLEKDILDLKSIFGEKQNNYTSITALFKILKFGWNCIWNHDSIELIIKLKKEYKVDKVKITFLTFSPVLIYLGRGRSQEILLQVTCGWVLCHDLYSPMKMVLRILCII